MVGEQAWRLISPEEKFEVIAQSQAVGIQWAVSLILLGGTLAVSFQTPALFWGSLVTAPIIFQFATSRRWRTLRPALLLQFLAARSVTRRYAYAIKSAYLEHTMLFRAALTHVEESKAEGPGLEAKHNPFANMPVWVALFPDAVVIISEKKGGATLEFGHVINKRFSLETVAADDEEYSQQLTLFLNYDDITYGQMRIKLESRYPASINAFGKQLQQIIDTPRAQRVDFENEDFSGDVRETEAALKTAIVDKLGASGAAPA